MSFPGSQSGELQGLGGKWNLAYYHPLWHGDSMNPLCVGHRHLGVACNQTCGSSLPQLFPLPSKLLAHSASSRNQYEYQNDILFSVEGKGRGQLAT